MKKIINIYIAFCMALLCIFSNLSFVYAQEEVSFYAYSNNIEEFDDYTQRKLDLFMYSYYGYIDSSLELGRGVPIINDNGYQQVLYPIWKDNEIVAKFIVVKVGDELSGTFSTTQVERFNTLIELTSEDNPMMLFGKDSLYAKIGDQFYDLNQEDIVCEDNFSIDINLDEMNVVDIKESIEYNQTIKTRTTTSKNLSWTKYSEQSDLSDGYCASHCLYNILRNIYITTYSLNTIKNALGPGFYVQTNVQNFLTNREFTYSAANSGYLSASSVQSIINGYSYIMIYVRNTIGTTDENTGVIVYSGHTMVLYGYTISSSGNTYRIWDTPNTHKIMDADTRLVTCDNTHVYRWDSGYVYNIDK